MSKSTIGGVTKADIKAMEFPFLTASDLEDAPEAGLREGWRPQFRLTHEFPFKIAGKTYKIPEGYITDKFSLPKIINAWEPKAPKWATPALIHDWLYSVGICQRKLADRILRHAMKTVGAKKIHIRIVYLAVKKGGRAGFGYVQPYNYKLVQKARADDEHIDLFLKD